MMEVAASVKEKDHPRRSWSYFTLTIMADTKPRRPKESIYFYYLHVGLWQMPVEFSGYHLIDQNVCPDEYFKNQYFVLHYPQRDPSFIKNNCLFETLKSLRPMKIIQQLFISI